MRFLLDRKRFHTNITIYCYYKFTIRTAEFLYYVIQNFKTIWSMRLMRLKYFYFRVKMKFIKFFSQLTIVMKISYHSIVNNTII